MKLRTSRGITISNYCGNFFMGPSNEIELPGIDCDKSFCAELKYDEKLDDKAEPSFQCAILYTTRSGERRIRVHTLSITCTSVLGNLFKGADCETILNYYARIAIREVPKQGVLTVRNNLIESCISLLYIYRKFCATSSSSGQLILPESLKLLPIYVLALIKNTVLRPGFDILPDERAYLLSLLNSIPVTLSTPFIYPRMFSLHNIPKECGIVEEQGNMKLPPLVRLSNESLSSEGAYLLENGQRIFLWLGKNISSKFLLEVFNVSGSVENLNCNELTFLPQENETSQQIHNIVNWIRGSRSSYAEVSILKQGDALEPVFFLYLVEDKGVDTLSYVDFLCHVHRQIQTKLS